MGANTQISSRQSSLAEQLRLAERSEGQRSVHPNAGQCHAQDEKSGAGRHNPQSQVRSICTRDGTQRRAEQSIRGNRSCNRPEDDHHGQDVSRPMLGRKDEADGLGIEKRVDHAANDRCKDDTAGDDDKRPEQHQCHHDKCRDADEHIPDENLEHLHHRSDGVGEPIEVTFGHDFSNL